MTVKWKADGEEGFRLRTDRTGVCHLILSSSGRESSSSGGVGASHR